MKLLFLTFAILISITCILFSSELHTLAVKPFDALEDVDAMTVRQSSTFFHTAIGRESGRKFVLIETEQIDRILEEQQATFRDCFSNECGIQLGKLLQARYIILGTVSGFGRELAFDVRLICVTTGRTEKTAGTQSSVDDIAEIRQALSNLAKEILDIQDVIQTGTLEINSNPSGADIYISGQKQQQQTPAVFTLPTGSYSVMIWKEGYGAVDWSLNILPNAQLTRNAVLTAEVGYISITTNPEECIATLRVGQRVMKRFKTPSVEPVQVGNYTLTLEKDKYEDMVIPVSILRTHTEIMPFTLVHNMQKTTGQLYLVIDPPDAKIIINGIEYQSGQDINLEWGRQEIVISKEGYITQSDIIEIEANTKTTPPPYRLRRAEHFGILYITSNPSEADIYIEGQLQDVKTGPQGLIENVPEGNIRIRLEKELYHPAEFNINVIRDTVNRKENVILKPNYGSLHITSTPANARIYINDAQYPINERTPTTIHRLKSGNYKITLKYEDYYDVTRFVVVEDEKTARLDVNLTPRFSPIHITSEPSGADVIINGRKVGTTPYRNQRMFAGDYQLQLSYPLYKEDRLNLRIEGGREEYHIERNLMPDFAVLSVWTNPDNAVIYLNNEKIGVSPIRNKRVNQGKATIRIEKDKYHSIEREIELNEDIPLTVNEELLPITGEIYVVSQPENDAYIFLNGEKQKGLRTPAIISNVIIGRHRIRVEKDNLKGEETVLVRENRRATVRIRMAEPTVKTEIKKKPFYKRWWFWTLVAGGGYAALSGSDSGGSEEETGSIEIRW